LVKPSRGHLLAYLFREISSKSPDRFSIGYKRAFVSPATHSQPALWRLGGGLMDFAMRKATRFAFLLLTAVTLGLLAAIPLVAAWRIPAGQCVAPCRSSRESRRLCPSSPGNAQSPGRRSNGPS